MCVRVCISFAKYKNITLGRFSLRRANTQKQQQIVSNVLQVQIYSQISKFKHHAAALGKLSKAHVYVKCTFSHSESNFIHNLSTMYIEIFFHFGVLLFTVNNFECFLYMYNVYSR